ncbi:hypothetical protein [Methylobacterium dankookense]|uniref:Uncharacterized protein n=1 Tax=Methylobacterium dankookense TaxID=560405 RepID=A0A564FX20_9HYPH|nr:hypothetical protein [Methylobacterium dankookense]GJD58385.1 hypothetical protein IFDJLNFL_4304 [Methylobacterium dankookense]VUF12316.1 hypothetical protein MTDSW087_02006 [Methylobacterium dankookense]
MLNGPFQGLGSSEGWTVQEPWLLPISDGVGTKASESAATAANAVRTASRPLFMAANGLALALALLLAAETATGWMGGIHTAPVAKAPVVTASAS